MTYHNIQYIYRLSAPSSVFPMNIVYYSLCITMHYDGVVFIFIHYMHSKCLYIFPELVPINCFA